MALEEPANQHGLKKHYPKAIWIDLLELDQLRIYSAIPERLKEVVYAESNRKVVVIDEVQKIPEILSTVHSLIEEKRGDSIYIDWLKH